MIASIIQSIMTADVVCLAKDAPLKEAVKLMSEKDRSCIVTDKDLKPVGIITERDIVRIAAQGRDLSELKVEDIMSSPVMTVAKNMDVYEAAIYLGKHHFRRIVVVDDEGKLLGLVTQTDLKDHLGAVYYVKLRKIDNIMIKDVVTAAYDENLPSLTRKMNENNISCLVICEDDKPLGIISEHDVTHLMAGEQDNSKLAAKDIITCPPVTTTKDTTIYEAAQIMRQRNVQRLAVVNKKDRLIGIITESDIIKHLERNYLESMRGIVEKEKTYINSIKEGILECLPGVDGIITWINMAGAQILGYQSTRDIIGKKINEIFVNSQDPEILFKMLKTTGIAKDFNTILRKSNGRQFYAEGTFYFVRDDDDNIVCMEGIIRDITERKKMEDKLKKYSSQLEHKVEERTAEIKKQNQELERINAQLRELTVHDGLTGIKNFRYFSQVLEMEFSRANRYNVPLSCVILDIDDFKFINDRFGHSAGDYALVKTAQLLQRAVRNTDIVARYGGDEFTLILPNTDIKNARMVGQKILERFRRYCLKKDLQELGKISLSIGIAALPDEKVKSYQQLMDYADKAMYRAKEHGKNNVCTWPEIHGQGPHKEAAENNSE